MLRKLRRLLAKKPIEKFLVKFLPEIGLGKVQSFECEDFRLGKYAVHTTKGKYEVAFWELLEGAKIFTLLLKEKGGESEFIRFTIEGNVSFVIMPEEFVIDRGEKRQVLDLVNGTAKVYPRGRYTEEVDYNMIEYKNPIMNSEVICIKQLLNKSFDYIFTS